MSGQGKLPIRKVTVTNNTFNVKARTKQEALELAMLLYDIYKDGGNVKIVNGQINANQPKKS